MHAILRRTGAARRSHRSVGVEPSDRSRWTPVAARCAGTATWCRSPPASSTSLAYLVANLGLALSRRQLLNGVWGEDWYGDERTVDVHVRQLRKKLGRDLPLATVWGVGYRDGMRRRLTIAILLSCAVDPGGDHRRQLLLHPPRRHLHHPDGLAGQAKAISTTFSTCTNLNRATLPQGARRHHQGRRLRRRQFRPVLNPDGTIAGTAPGRSDHRGQLDVPALQAGEQVTGHTRSLLAYSAVPTAITGVARLRARSWWSPARSTIRPTASATSSGSG